MIVRFVEYRERKNADSSWGPWHSNGRAMNGLSDDMCIGIARQALVNPSDPNVEWRIVREEVSYG